MTWLTIVNLVENSMVHVGRHSGNPLIALVYDDNDQSGIKPSEVRIAFVRVNEVDFSRNVFDRITASEFWKKEGSPDFEQRVRDAYQKAKER